MKTQHIHFYVMYIFGAPTLVGSWFKFTVCSSFQVANMQISILLCFYMFYLNIFVFLYLHCKYLCYIFMFQFHCLLTPGLWMQISEAICFPLMPNLPDLYPLTYFSTKMCLLMICKYPVYPLTYFPIISI